MTATGIGLTDFAFFVSGQQPDCSGSNSTATYTAGAVASNLLDNQWVCFKAKNSLGIYGYAELEVDLTAPTPALTQANTTVTATGAGLTDFAFFVSGQQPDCSGANSTATYTAGAVASNLLDNQWVCFKAQNDKEVYGYSEMQVDLASPSIIIPTTSIETTEDPSNVIEVVEQTTTTATVVPEEDQVQANELNLVQSNDAVSVTNQDLTDHQFFVSSSEPECSESDDSRDYISNTSVSGLQAGQWVCFRANDSQGTTIYSKIHVSPAPLEAESLDPLVEQEKPVKPNDSNALLWSGLIFLFILIVIIGARLFVQNRRH